MELLDIIKIPNQFLEHYVIFKGFKFILGFYLIIICLNIIFLLYVILVKRKYWLDFSFGRTMPKIRGTMDKRWQEILNVIQQGDLIKYKSIVVEARNMLFEIFNKIGYEGDNLGQQLNLMVGYQVSNLEELKEANQIVENILEDVNYKLEKTTAEQAVVSFGKALKEMEAIKEVGL